MGTVVTSGKLAGVMVSALAWNTKEVVLIPALGTILPIFTTPTTILYTLTNLSSCQNRSVYVWLKPMADIQPLYGRSEESIHIHTAMALCR